jgi:hypothetical protein
MKILQAKYPMGSFPFQKSPGRYIDEFYYDNLRVLAKKITQDMTFLMVCFSSTLEVGTGKSVFMTQTGEAWSQLMWEEHGIKLDFTKQNVVWRPKDLIERAFQVPKYSFLLLDEWEDAHYWSELGTTLRQFFRKCRQLNLFIGIIIPNYFQLPMNYALGRSIFAIDVKFTGDFERGNYSFYNFEQKRTLYILGKKTHNYHVVKPAFSGVFNDGYGIPKEEYLKAKREDLEKWDNDEEQTLKPELIRFDTKIRILRILFDRKILTTRMISEIYDCPLRTAQRWMTEAIERERNALKNDNFGSFNLESTRKANLLLTRQVILKNNQKKKSFDDGEEEEIEEDEVVEE